MWSPLFQATWDKLNTMHKGKIEKIVPKNELMTKLDSFRWKEESVMPEGAYATFAGPATKEFAIATAMRMKKQFGIEMDPNALPFSPLGNNVYGALARDIEFQKQFFAPKRRVLMFKDRSRKVYKTKFFGTAGSHSDKYSEAVKVIDYKDKGKDFILSIATKHPDERLIIYRPIELKDINFTTAIKHVVTASRSPLSGKRGSLNDSGLHSKDTVKIPYLAIDLKTNFIKQLQGGRYYKNDSNPWRISGAYQVTRFELFEKGAKVRVQTGAGSEPFGGPPPTKTPKIKFIPRDFICDRPFFVFLWRDKAKLPYLAIFVDGPDALTTFSNK